MSFDLPRALEVLSRTPSVLESLLDGLSDQWLDASEGPDTFTPRDVVGHLIHGELASSDFDRKGRHPALGQVTLGQLLASWVVHDLGHVRQVVRVLARQYDKAVGPWKEYLTILES
jgi:hypothetical protein